jgi:NTP pyrophosphatase (non-canonical NTP hydrolase)
MIESDYRIAVARLINPTLNSSERLANWATGLCGESAEVDEVIDQNQTFSSVSYVKLLDELSDCRWYLTALCISLGINVPELDSSRLVAYAPPNVYSRSLMRRAGKIADVLKKVVFHSHGLPRHRPDLYDLVDKYAQVYFSLLAGAEITDDFVTSHNYQKLSARYKNLEFTSEQSINRTA